MADSPEYKPYAWKSARSRNGRNSSVEEMQERGRAPAFDQGGNVRGFRSRPGAPLSPRDSIAGKSIPAPAGGGLSDPDEWGGFFKGNSPNGVRLGYTASNPAIAAAAVPASPASASSTTMSGGIAPMGGQYYNSSKPGRVFNSDGTIAALGDEDGWKAAMAPFHQPNPSPSMVASPSAPKSPSLLTDPTRSTAGGFLGNVIQSSTDFLKRSGITPPSAPVGFPSAYTPTGARWNEVRFPGGTSRTVQSRYGWGSSYLPT